MDVLGFGWPPIQAFVVAALQAQFFRGLLEKATLPQKQKQKLTGEYFTKELTAEYPKNSSLEQSATQILLGFQISCGRQLLGKPS